MRPDSPTRAKSNAGAQPPRAAPPPLARPMDTDFIPIVASPEQEILELSYTALGPEPPILDVAAERPYTVMPSPDATKAPTLKPMMPLDDDNADDNDGGAERDRSYTSLPNNKSTAGARQDGVAVPPGLLPPPPPPM